MWDMNNLCSVLKPFASPECPFSFSSLSTSTHKPIHVLSLALYSCHSSSNTCQPHCPLLKQSEPMQPCSCALFSVPLPKGTMLLFLMPFLTGFEAASKGASVLPLREAWCSLLSECDNGPHMVVLQRLTKTFGPGAWALPPFRPTRR